MAKFSPVKSDTYIMEVRRGLEIQSATLAAERATLEQKLTLSRLISEMGASLDDVPKLTELDIEFHYTIAQATSNPVLIGLLLNIKNLISDYIRAGNLDGAILDQDYAEHRRINDAIQAASPEAAAQAMLEQLDSGRDQHLSLIRQGQDETAGLAAHAPRAATGV